MRAENAGGLIFLEFAGSPRELLICCGEEMESADGGVDRCGAEKAASILQCVDNSGVATAGEQHEAVGSVENEGLVVRNVVFHPTVSGVDLRARGIVFFRYTRGTWPVSQTPGKNSCALSCTTKTPPADSNSFFIAIIGLGLWPRRSRKMPLATWTRESAAGLDLANSRRSVTRPKVWSS